MAAVELAFQERVSLLYLLWRAEQRGKRRPRCTWVHQVLQRREHFGEFHHLLQELRLDDGRFQRYHRLSLGQFEDLLSRVGLRIARLDTNYRRSIPPAERLSICLRFLATGDSFRTIAFSFRVGVSTVSQIIPQVATAIWDCLVDDFMAVPSLGDWQSIAEEFQERWHFPLCCGALDGKHVQTKAPPNSGSMFYNYKGTFFIVLLAVVDARYRFRVIDVGGTGGPATGVFWPTPPLVRLFGLGLSICLLTSLYLVENTVEPSPMCLWLMKRSRCGVS
ncbi:protein ANTAGONIST OF LIKE HETEROCHROMATIN PROTEIN 1-like [Oreochromis niloticus]|uniref:protein ANTAGONIST OF LIKE HETEROCHROMATIN PROTEIN 1-like n=1 Tax=Oreochromis niloticus TaxID=8128 RepID=UPI00090474BE|nr:protein ANTAGONIST OF LIKE HETEROCHROMATIN PROTEIN 1-like [Oreochromis niloticus]